MANEPQSAPFTPGGKIVIKPQAVVPVRVKVEFSHGQCIEFVTRIGDEYTITCGQDFAPQITISDAEVDSSIRSVPSSPAPSNG